MYKKIIILGGCGSGKSTLANRISLATGYPVYHLDNLFLNSKWGKENKDKWGEICKQFLSKDVGVVDGNYIKSLSDRIVWADLIIFIDIPVYIQFYRVLKRFFRISLRLDKRYGQPDSAKNVFTFKFLQWIYNFDKEKKFIIFSMLELAKDKKVITIKNPQKLDIEKLLNL